MYVCIVVIGYASSCGRGLKELCSSPQVQMFLNSLQPADLLANKPMYLPGCLRKVHVDYMYIYQYNTLYSMQLKSTMEPSQLQDVIINASYFKLSLSLKQLIEEEGYVHLAFGVLLETVVISHGALVSQNGTLVNVGDFVEMNSDEVCRSTFLLHYYM